MNMVSHLDQVETVATVKVVVGEELGVAIHGSACVSVMVLICSVAVSRMISGIGMLSTCVVLLVVSGMLVASTTAVVFSSRCRRFRITLAPTEVILPNVMTCRECMPLPVVR